MAFVGVKCRLKTQHSIKKKKKHITPIKQYSFSGRGKKPSEWGCYRTMCRVLRYPDTGRELRAADLGFIFYKACHSELKPARLSVANLIE